MSKLLRHCLDDSEKKKRYSGFEVPGKPNVEKI
jgi:hypothetical protein